MTLYENYSLLFQLVGFIVVSIGLLVAIIQLYLLKKQRYSEHDWNRRSKAFEYSFSTDPEMIKVLNRLDNHLKITSNLASEISLVNIDKLSESEYPEIRHDIHFALARLEYMCVAMRHSVADEGICFDLLQNRTVSLFRFFRQYIENVREQRGSNAIFENLEMYANKWGTSKKTKKRKPTHE